MNLESIFNNIDEGLIILTPSGDQVYFNMGAKQLFQRIGVTLKESENILRAMPDESSRRISITISEVLDKRETIRVFSDQFGEDGARLFFEEIYVPTIDDNTITHINLLLRDITEGKIFEKKITGMATELRNLIDKANAVIIGTDSRGYITDWNRHTESLTRYSKNEALTQKFTTLLMKESEGAIFDKMINAALQGESVLNEEVPVLCKDKRKLIFLLSATVRYNLENKVTGVVFVGQDITQRLKIEQELKFAHERLLFHLENSPLGFIEWSIELKPISWTNRVEEIFGWSLKEFSASGQTGHDLIYEEDFPWVSKIGDDLLNGRIERKHIQHRNIRKDGVVIWCEWFNSVLKDETGKVVTVMSLVQDITERKSNELNLQEALLELEAYKETLEHKVEERTNDLMEALKKEKDVVEMKSRFVSIASHEFRTPLSSIQHTTNVIRKGKRWSGDGDLKERLKDIERQTKHMMYLLDDVLTYGKSEAGKIQLVLTSTVLKNFLQKIIEDVKHTTKDTHAIQLKMADPTLKIRTDEKLLRSILINLLTNAIKYSPGKDRVILQIDSTKHLIKFIVTDKGIGIPEGEQDKIFEAFIRGRSVESIQGTGLGLSIVKKSVELMKGNIKLDSKVDIGTSIIVTIPKLILE